MVERHRAMKMIEMWEGGRGKKEGCGACWCEMRSEGPKGRGRG